MKMVVIYSFNSKEKATAKAADLKVNKYRLDIFEEAVDIATCDLSDTSGGQCATDGGVWIVAGTKK
jgi:hypothetical protein